MDRRFEISSDRRSIRFLIDKIDELDTDLSAALSKATDTPFLVGVFGGAGDVPEYIEMEIPQGEALADMMKHPLTASDVRVILRSFVDLVDVCACEGLPFLNVALDADLIFVQPDRRAESPALSFIYLPVKARAARAADIRDFFLGLASALHPSDPDAEDMRDKLSAYLKESDTFDLLGFSRLIKELSEGSRSYGAEKEPGLEQDEPKESKVVAKREDPGTSVLNAIDPDDPELAELFATLDDDEDGEDQPRSQPRQRPSHLAYELRHRRTGDAAIIKDRPVVVGKSMHADFQIKGTTTVSRMHAKLVCEDGACWIQDIGSLNGTFVNDERVAAQERRRLSAGDEIRLSDERFTLMSSSGVAEKAAR